MNRASADYKWLRRRGAGGEGFTESWWQHSKENVFNWLGGKPITRRSVGQLVD